MNGVEDFEIIFKKKKKKLSQKKMKFI